MDTNNNKTTSRDPNWLKGWLGDTKVENDFGKDGVDVKPAIPSGSFSDIELKKLPKAEQFNGTNSVSEVTGYLQDISDSSYAKIVEMRSYKTLVPEIKKARSIWVPSIMSPNDIQTSAIPITVNDPHLSSEINADLSAKLTDYFNTEIGLGSKVERWIGDAAFEKGSVPVITIPKSAITIMSQTVDELEKAKESGKALCVGTEDAQGKVPYIGVEAFEGKLTDNLTVFKEADIESITLSFEDLPIEVGDVSEDDVKDFKEFKKGSLEAVKTFAKKKAKDISLTTDFRALASPTEVVDKTNKALMEKIKGTFYGTSSNLMMAISPDDEVVEGDHPTMMELPTESVIPIHVPGTPSAHVGYFVLLDEWGNPINGEYSDKTMGDKCPGQVPNNTVDVIYNNSPARANASQHDRTVAAQSIFGMTIRKMLEDKLNDMDLSGITVHHHQAISNILMSRLAADLKVRILFVPANFISYYAFDYRSNGTGKGLLEDSTFIISLRNNLMVGNVIANLKNAMDNKVIELDLPEDTKNVEQIVKVVHDTFVSKRMFKFGHDPVAIARNIASNSVQILPKGVNGLNNLNISTSRESSNVTTPDTNMLEELTNLIVTDTGVPYAALNELGEREYSRSVATTNLFFSNAVACKQLVVNSTTSKFVRSYTQLSYPLLQEIHKVLEEKPNTEINQETIARIINSIEVKLPTPKIAASKAQFEELEEMIKVVNDLSEIMFNDEFVVASDRMEPKDANAALRASVRKTAIVEILKRLGNHSLTDMPGIMDISQSNLREYNEVIQNVASGLLMLNKISEPPEDNEDHF